jgi:hypothetical protein
MIEEFSDLANDSHDAFERRAALRYGVLTFALFVPLLLAFVFVRNLYPFAASTEMTEGGDLQAGRTYYILRGETVAGETFDLPPIELTNALAGRNWSLVAATVENRSFTIPSPHPANVALVVAAGGIENLPRAARLEDLMRSWGLIFNLRLPASSTRRLRAVRLDAYRWEGTGYGDYGRFIETWRAEL